MRLRGSRPFSFLWLAVLGCGGSGADPGHLDSAPDSAAVSPRDAGEDARALPRDASVSDPSDARVGGSAADAAAHGASADAAEPDRAAPGDAGSIEAGMASTASCDAGAFCADFEQAAGAGALPAPWAASMPSCAGDGKVAIDDTVAHGGQRSLRVSASGGFCNHAFAAPALAALGDELWIRMYARFGQSPGTSHSTFFAMHDRVSGKDLRLGVQSGVLIWNRETDDATLPELSPRGISLSVAPTPGAWQCIELHLRGSAGALETYVDGAQVAGLVVDGTATMDIDSQWLRPGAWRAQVEDARFGWESYSDQAMTLWYDDVVIASARPGCAARE